ncbi:MAG TPA: hypothetical protein VG144_05970 [Gaiellaceae bacterium]|jgi:hypothetical protein|nr:hypothetical protein [Gaiellaceae bacterium]
MSETPPPDQPTQTTARPYGGGGGGLTVDVARLPIPGNAEFALYLVALIVAWIVAWASDVLNAASWFDFFQWLTIAYLLSRGIAKASRVLEQ